MKRPLLLFSMVLAAILFALPCSAQYMRRALVAKPELPDSADAALYGKKHFWRAAAETFACNMALWAFDRHVLKGWYAYISWDSVKENFKTGFEWDDDHLHENMLSHPYNG